jgi:hypothetical protein
LFFKVVAMKKEPTTRSPGFSVHALMPKIAISPRRPLSRRKDERKDDESADERAPPPPGMGALVDKSA